MPNQRLLARFDIIVSMKILAAPLIATEKADAQYYLCRNLADLFVQSGHTCMISASRANGFRKASLYPSVPLKKPLFTEAGHSYEEWLYAAGAGSERWLSSDVDNLLETADATHPDLIISMDRIGAVIAARLRNIPCISFVSSAVFRTSSLPPKILRGTNQVLSAYHLEQEFSLADFYRRFGRLFAFGTAELQSFPSDLSVERIGMPHILPVRTARTNRVVIFLGSCGKRASFLCQIIREAFLGAPYAVYAWYPGVRPEKDANLHFIENPRPDLIAGAFACIHDGNPYLFQNAIAQGVQQLIITDHSYPRIYTAQTAQRSGCGLYLYEEELSMSSLYETYRRLVSADAHENHTLRLKDDLVSLGDLTELLNRI